MAETFTFDPDAPKAEDIDIKDIIDSGIDGDPSESTDTTSEDIPTLLRRVAELAHENSQNRSRYESSVGLIKKGKKELEEQRERSQRDSDELEALRQSVNLSKLELPKVAELTEEEKSAFANSIPTIEKLIDRKVAHVLGANMKSLLSRIDKLERQLSESEKTGSARAAILSAQASVPDMDELRRHPAFQAFLSEIDDATESTHEHLLNDAIGSGRRSVVKRVFDTFRQRTAKTKRSNGAPAMSSAASEQPVDNQKRLKRSDYKGLSNQYRDGKITQTDWAKISEAFDKASRENRLIND